MLELLRPLRRRLQGRPLVRRLLVGGGWMFAGNSAAALMNAAKGFLLARLLGVEQYGTFGLIAAVVLLGNQLLDVRSSEALVQFATRFLQREQREKAAALFKSSVMLDAMMRLLGLLGLLLLAPWVVESLALGQGSVVLMRGYALVLLAATPIGTCTALLQLTSRYSQLARIEACVAAAELVGCILLMAIGGGLRHLVAILLMTACMRGLLILYCGVRAAKSLQLPAWRATRLGALQGERRALGRFLAWTKLISIVKALQQQGDLVVVGFFLGPTAVGYYRLARQIVQLVLFPFSAVFSVAYAELARLASERGQRAVVRTMLRLAGITAVCAGLPIGAVILFGRPAIRILAGAEYMDALPAAYVMLIGVFCLATSQYAYASLVALGHARRAASAFTAGSVIQLSLLVLLTPGMGIIGAALAYTAFAAVRSLLFFHFLLSGITPSSTRIPATT